jgi:recombination protein RecA
LKAGRSWNQLRQRIGVVYGNPETTTGGNALKFYAGVRLDIRKIGVVKNGAQPVGNAREGREEQGRPAVQGVRARGRLRQDSYAS